MIFSIQPKNFTEHDTFSYGISKTPLFKFQTLSADKQFLQRKTNASFQNVYPTPYEASKTTKQYLGPTSKMPNRTS